MSSPLVAYGDGSLTEGVMGQRVLKRYLLFLTSIAFVDTKAKPHTRRGEILRFYCNFFQTIDKGFISGIGTQSNGFIICC